MPFLEITTTSPFSISLINSAPIMSNAQVSDARTGESPIWPSTRGLMPRGSLAPTSFFIRHADKGVSAFYSLQRVDETVSEAGLFHFFAIRCNTTSVSDVVWQIAPLFISSLRNVRALVKLPL